MASQKTKLTVGLFMTAGITIALLAFLWLGMSRYLEKGRYYATYFNESVQGLSRDSPVKYRGVSIGRVWRIDVAPDLTLIEVVMQVDKEHKIGTDMVARLSVVGITGAMFIELDKREDGEPDRSPALSFEPEYPVIASRSSNISELLQGLDAFLTQLRAIDLEGISEKVKSTLDSVSRAIDDADIKALSANLESSFDNINTIVDREKWSRIISSMDEAMISLKSVTGKADNSFDRMGNALASLERITTENEQSIEEAIDGFRTAVYKANVFLDEGTSLFAGTDRSLSYLQQNLSQIARNLEQATDNLNRITQILADQPSQLFFGEPPPPRKIEK